MDRFIVSQHGLSHLSILAMLAKTNEITGESLVSRCPMFSTCPPLAKSKIVLPNSHNPTLHPFDLSSPSTTTTTLEREKCVLLIVKVGGAKPSWPWPRSGKVDE